MSRPPLIAHVIHHLEMGGLENGLVNLINRIPADRYRHCVICIEDFSNFRERIRRPDVEVLAMHRSSLGTLALYRRLYALFRVLRPAIVHSRNLSGLDALLPAAVSRVPHRIHGEHGWDVTDIAGASPKMRMLKRLHSPLVERYVTVSQDLARYLHDRVGIPARRITQIYNGVDTALFAPDDSTCDALLPEALRGDDKVIVGTVGRLQPVKDQLALVRAFARMLRDNPSLRATARLAFIGGGPMRETLESCVREAQLADVVWFAGPRDDVAVLYRCLDVFALPSLNEGISNTLLEAMASGLPIVATAVGGNVELVADGINGVLVPPASPGALADALAAYVSDADLRIRHGRASRDRVLAKFSLDAMVQGYLALYDRTLASRD